MTSPRMMMNRPVSNQAKPTGTAARRWKVATLAGLGLLALGGCTDNEFMQAGCPNVGVLRDAGTLHSDGNVAILSGLVANCAYSDTNVTIAASLQITGRAKEGVTDGAIPVTYFVTITDPDRNIISKKSFTTTVPLTGGSGLVEEQLTQVIPAPKTMDARWYEMLVGFQLTPEEVAANRANNEGR